MQIQWRIRDRPSCSCGRTREQVNRRPLVAKFNNAEEKENETDIPLRMVHSFFAQLSPQNASRQYFA